MGCSRDTEEGDKWVEKSGKAFPLVRIGARESQAEQTYRQKRRGAGGISALCAVICKAGTPTGAMGKCRPVQGPPDKADSMWTLPRGTGELGNRVQGGQDLSKTRSGANRACSHSRVLGLGEMLGPPVQRRRGAGPVLQLLKPTPDFLGPWCL